MRHQLTATFIATALLGLCACGGGDNNTPPLTGGIRVANGLTDSAGLDMAISNVTSFSAIAIDSASAINYIPVSAVVSYKATLTSNGSSFTLGGISADQDKVTTIFTFGEMGSGTQGAFAAEESVTDWEWGSAVVFDMLVAAAEPISGIILFLMDIEP